jgi:hypothetical protein
VPYPSIQRQGRRTLSNNSNNSDVKVTYIDDLVAAPVLAELLRRENAGQDVVTRRAVLRLSAVVPAVTALGPRRDREDPHRGRAWWMRWPLSVRSGCHVGPGGPGGTGWQWPVCWLQKALVDF